MLFRLSVNEQLWSNYEEGYSMATPTPETMFTRDILGNFVCNTFAEATASGPFDVIIIGGGTFGLALAQDLFFRSKRFDQGPGGVPQDILKPFNYRILVLEAGPFALPEHVQDLPSLGLGNPGTQPNPGSPLPATRQELIAQGKDKQPILENWGLPWNSAERFGGLAYCLGGRSLYFGGWSPQYLATEMHTATVGSITAQTLWPTAVVQDLTLTNPNRFFLEAAKQTGVTTSNDFINGALHDFYRRTLFQSYATIPNTVPLAELPDYIQAAPEDVTPLLEVQLNNPPYAGFADSIKLDAPLAVQAQTRAGFFPFNKFSSVPLAIAAARAAIGSCALLVMLRHLLGHAAMSRFFSRSSFARPNMCRFNIFRRLTCPSVGPLLYFSVTPAFTAL
jgi:hypothetical protein